MPRSRQTIVVASLIVLICGASLADTVVPRDSVVNWVNVREEAVPRGQINIIGHLHPGENAKFLGEEVAYFEIQLDNGASGFVSKTWTL